MALLVQQASADTGYAYYANLRSTQTFTMPSGYDKIEYVRIICKKNGTPPGNINIAIHATSGGQPTGGALTSVNLTSANFSTGYTWTTFDFSDVIVTPGAKYAIVMTQASVTGTTNAVLWQKETSDVYAGGSAFYWNTSGAVTSIAGDFSFEVYGSVSVVAPTLSTTSASSVTASGATLGGNVSSAGGGTVSSRGVTYSSSDSTPDYGSSPTVTIGSGTGAFSQAIIGLTPATTYYFRAWAINQAGLAYGSVLSFLTLSTTPTVTSVGSSNISATTSTCSGNVTSTGGSAVTERGIVYSTSATPTTAGDKVSSGTGIGAFSSNLTALTSGTTYYWRAYAINANGTVYGTEYTFTTKEIVTQWSQKFTTTSAGTLTKVSLYLKEALGTSATATVKIYSDDSGDPDTAIATATKTVTGSNYTWYDFSFNTALSATTAYWIVLDNPYVVGNYAIYWGADNGGTGVLKYSTDNTTSWDTKATTVATFKTFVQPSLTVNYDVSIDYKKRYI